MTISTYFDTLIDDKHHSASDTYPDDGSKKKLINLRVEIVGLDLLLWEKRFHSSLSDDHSTCDHSEIDSVVLIRRKLKQNDNTLQSACPGENYYVGAGTSPNQSEARKSKRRGKRRGRRTSGRQLLKEQKSQSDYLESSCSDFSSQGSLCHSVPFRAEAKTKKELLKELYFRDQVVDQIKVAKC
jgi:hypothetical protein